MCQSAMWSSIWSCPAMLCTMRTERAALDAWAGAFQNANLAMRLTTQASCDQSQQLHTTAVGCLPSLVWSEHKIWCKRQGG